MRKCAFVFASAIEFLFPYSKFRVSSHVLRLCSLLCSPFFFFFFFFFFVVVVVFFLSDLCENAEHRTRRKKEINTTRLRLVLIYLFLSDRSLT